MAWSWTAISEDEKNPNQKSPYPTAASKSGRQNPTARQRLLPTRDSLRDSEIHNASVRIAPTRAGTYMERCSRTPFLHKRVKINPDIKASRPIPGPSSLL